MTEVWMHKETGDLALVTPAFFERRASKFDKSKDQNIYKMYDIDIVAYEEVGFAFENEYKCMFLLSPKVKKYFEVLGEF